MAFCKASCFLSWNIHFCNSSHKKRFALQIYFHLNLEVSTFTMSDPVPDLRVSVVALGNDIAAEPTLKEVIGGRGNITTIAFANEPAVRAFTDILDKADVKLSFEKTDGSEECLFLDDDNTYGSKYLCVLKDNVKFTVVPLPKWAFDARSKIFLGIKDAQVEEQDRNGRPKNAIETMMDTAKDTADNSAIARARNAVADLISPENGAPVDADSISYPCFVQANTSKHLKLYIKEVCGLHSPGMVTFEVRDRFDRVRYTRTTTIEAFQQLVNSVKNDTSVVKKKSRPSSCGPKRLPSASIPHTGKYKRRLSYARPVPKKKANEPTKYVNTFDFSKGADGAGKVVPIQGMKQTAAAMEIQNGYSRLLQKTQYDLLEDHICRDPKAIITDQQMVEDFHPPMQTLIVILGGQGNKKMDAGEVSIGDDDQLVMIKSMYTSVKDGKSIDSNGMNFQGYYEGWERNLMQKAINKLVAVVPSEARKDDEGGDLAAELEFVEVLFRNRRARYGLEPFYYVDFEN